MLRVVAHRFGPPAAILRCEEVEAPPVEPGRVLVRMRASPINPSDLIPVTGAYAHRTLLPFVPGFEGVGEVAALGEGVTGLRPGDRVLPLGSAGGWQALKSAPAEWCVRVPPDIADEDAAFAYVNPLTARLMVEALAPRPGERIGLNAAASAIGRILIRRLHAAAARTVAIVRSAEAAAALADEPVDEIVREGARLPRLAGGLDAVGGPSGAALARAVRPGGLVLHYGLLSGVPLDARLLGGCEARVRPFWLREWVHGADRAAFHRAMDRVFADLRAGLARTDVAARFPLTAIGEALELVAAPARRGKVLLLP